MAPCKIGDDFTHCTRAGEIMTEDRKTILAIVVGLLTMACGAIIISNDPHAIVNWIGGFATVLGGALIEEKFLLRRR